MVNQRERLSANFTMGEYLASPTATANKITEQFNPPLRILNNIRKINKTVQEARDKFGKPIAIGSGYRCDRLNALVGGARNSEHKDALGIDARTHNYTESEIIELIEIFIGLGVKRIGLAQTFIHIGFSDMSIHPQNVVWDYSDKRRAPESLRRHREKWIKMMREQK
jgi:hypothetical protein